MLRVLPIGCLLQAMEIVEKESGHGKTPDLQISDVHFLQVEHLVNLEIVCNKAVRGERLPHLEEKSEDVLDENICGRQFIGHNQA